MYSTQGRICTYVRLTNLSTVYQTEGIPEHWEQHENRTHLRGFAILYLHQTDNCSCGYGWTWTNYRLFMRQVLLPHKLRIHWAEWGNRTPFSWLEAKHNKTSILIPLMSLRTESNCRNLFTRQAFYHWTTEAFCWILSTYCRILLNILNIAALQRLELCSHGRQPWIIPIDHSALLVEIAGSAPASLGLQPSAFTRLA